MGLVRKLIRGILAEVKPRAPQEGSNPTTNVEAGQQPAQYTNYNPHYEQPSAAAGAYGVPPQSAVLPPANDEPGANSNGSGSDAKKRRRPNKVKMAYEVVTDADKRRERSVYLTHLFAYSLVIVGSIFLALVCTGNYPTTVENMKYLGIYVDNIVKYALFVFSGVVGVIACVLARSALSGNRTLALPMLLLLVTILSLLASIGLSIYILTINVGLDWWGWLLSILMLIQRVLYVIATVMALHTLREASSNQHVKAQVTNAVVV